MKGIIKIKFSVEYISPISQGLLSTSDVLEFLNSTLPNRDIYPLDLFDVQYEFSK